LLPIALSIDISVSTSYLLESLHLYASTVRPLAHQNVGSYNTLQ
jgi:hypothetical protein